MKTYYFYSNFEELTLNDDIEDIEYLKMYLFT